MVRLKTNYHSARKNSRGLASDDPMGSTPCEMCVRRLSEGHPDPRRYTAEQVHHIATSFRGHRTHESDGSDLLGVCQTCHDRLHNRKGNSITAQKISSHLAQIGMRIAEEAKNMNLDASDYARRQRKKEKIKKV